MDRSSREGESAMTSSARPTPDWDLEQIEVILDDPGSWQLVVAGPGAGKSAVACQRIASLVDEGVQSSRILLVSFTRTAVAELRDRIVSYAAAGEHARGVRISTIDSHAWSLRVGFEEEPLADFVDDSSYDLSISRAVDLFRKEDQKLLDFMSRVEHLIIDEAQDVVGIRADLVIEILLSLSEECGVTILADPAQAIYGFTSDDREDGEQGKSLLQQLETESPRNFVTRELRQIHRIQNQQLLDVFHRTRDEVEQPSGVDGHVDRVVSIIRETALENLGATSYEKIAEHLARYENESLLVLFRRRMDVLLTSSFCSGAGVQHRLRMSGVPTVVRPWIGWLFAEFDRALITRQEFEQLWEQRSGISPIPFTGEERENSWTVLRQLAAGDRDGVGDLVHLRRIVSRSRPPVELCLPDLGTTGPILGTIHASKGREADTVALVLPNARYRLQPDSDAAELEEGRVYYVGATRAREALVTASNGSSPADYLNSGRIYRPLRTTGNKPPRVQLEVGREGDADRLAHLGWTSAGDIQSALAVSARQTLPLKGVCLPDQGFDIRLTLKHKTPEGITREIEIGQMGEAFQRDLRQVWSHVDTSNRLRPGDYMDYLYLIGATTVALSDSERTAVRPPYSSSGFALAPVIKGFTVVQFLYRNRRRSWW